MGSADIPEEDRRVVAERIDLLLSGQQDFISTEMTSSQKHWVDFVYNQIQQKVKATISKDGEPSGEIQSVCIDQIEHTNSNSTGAEMEDESWKEFVLLCKSDQREQKEISILERSAQRLEKDLQKLTKSVSKGLILNFAVER